MVIEQETKLADYFDLFSTLSVFAEKAPGLGLNLNKLRDAFMYLAANDYNAEQAAQAFNETHDAQGEWIEKPTFLCH